MGEIRWCKLPTGVDELDPNLMVPTGATRPSGGGPPARSSILQRCTRIDPARALAHRGTENRDFGSVMGADAASHGLAFTTTHNLARERGRL